MELIATDILHQRNVVVANRMLVAELAKLALDGHSNSLFPASEKSFYEGIVRVGSGQKSMSYHSHLGLFHQILSAAPCCSMISVFLTCSANSDSSNFF